MTLEGIEENIRDIAGIRVICSFPDDIYELAESFLRQDDITLIERKDYIKNPKESGYRSLHLIVQVPIFLQNTKKLCPSSSIWMQASSGYIGLISNFLVRTILISSSSV